MVWRGSGRGWLAALLVALMILAPSLAAARAGGSYRLGGGSGFSSMGSRGFQTFGNNGAAPIQRSLTPQTAPGPVYGGSGYGGYGYGHPFLSGMFGGFFGSWIGGMLFPHWGMGYGVGGMFGSVFSWLFLLGLVWFLFRLFGRRGGSGIHYGGMPYGGPSMMGQGMPGPGPYGGSYAGMGPMSPGFGALSGTPRLATIGVAQSDYQEFEAILQGVQTAWSNGDLGAMRHYTTPEMLSYFSEQLAENESQGVVNKVENVELIKGEVREAWDEGRMHYATALMHWRARDYTIRSGGAPQTGELIVGGDAQHPSEASEMWTFVRSPGGRWRLSAVQQV
ncbi:MAG TPA: TIM44-like domain-containing protein [Stellaceae bacterium]|jgi:predicted lipid-binding transport protein (Tim44 family)